MFEKLSAEDYYSKNMNPSGWLIDKIESKLPVNANHIKSLKSSIGEAKKKGWIPFELIEKKFSEIGFNKIIISNFKSGALNVIINAQAEN